MDNRPRCGVSLMKMKSIARVLADRAVARRRGAGGRQRLLPRRGARPVRDAPASESSINLKDTNAGYKLIAGIRPIDLLAVELELHRLRQREQTAAHRPTARPAPDSSSATCRCHCRSSISTARRAPRRGRSMLAIRRCRCGDSGCELRLGRRRRRAFRQLRRTARVREIRATARQSQPRHCFRWASPGHFCSFLATGAASTH